MAVQPRMGMPPPGQQLGQPAGQQTIVLGRPGQPGSVVTAAGGQIVRQQFVPPGGGIRVQGSGLATIVSAGVRGNVVTNQPGFRPRQPGSKIGQPLPPHGRPIYIAKRDNGGYQYVRFSGNANSVDSPVPAANTISSIKYPFIVRNSTPTQLLPQISAQQTNLSTGRLRYLKEPLHVKSHNGQYQLVRLNGTTNSITSTIPPANRSSSRQYPFAVRNSTPEQLFAHTSVQQNAVPTMSFLSKQTKIYPQGRTSSPVETTVVVCPFLTHSSLHVARRSVVPPPPTSSNATSTKPSITSFASRFFSLQGGTTISTKFADKKLSTSSSQYSATCDEDINDVAAMGGVNLAEESQRIASSGLISNHVLRSCKDETFLQTGLLKERISQICKDRGMDAPPIEVVTLISHATQERIKTLLEKLSVVAEHKVDIIKAIDKGERYNVTQDVRGQLQFLNDVEAIERTRNEEAKKELLCRAVKSRAKNEDPEKAKLKAKAKELRRLEEEQLRHENANNTARLAIDGPRKRLKLDGSDIVSRSANVTSNYGLMGIGGILTEYPGNAGLENRPRTKRVHLRDLLFLMEQEKELKRSPLLWKSYSS